MLARAAHLTHQAAPPAGRGRGPGKVARLLLVVARWPRAAVLPGRAGRCHAPAHRAVPVARGQVLALVAPDSDPAPLEVQAALGCGQAVARVPLEVRALARFLVAPTPPTALPPRAAPRTAELRAPVHRREAEGAPVVVLAEDLAGAAAGAARAAVGVRAPTVKSFRPRRHRHMWRPMPPYRRAKSSSSGVPRPKSWRRA
ncbi:MAG: hypothetical protein ABSA91_10380 [Acidimicrobiales bacterium]